MTKSRNKPSHYPTLLFHAFRLSTLVSATALTGILVYFCYHLKNDGFKLPWTFLIVLAASSLTLISLILTSFIHCCGTLSPLLNLFLNIPLLILWLLGLCLLSWNIFGVLSHTCNIANLASNDGVFVCQVYKTLFSFAVIGTLGQLAQVVLDVKARRTQTRLGKYDKMKDSQDVKMQTLPVQGVSHAAVGHGYAHGQPQIVSSVRDEQYRDDGVGWRPGQRNNMGNDYGQLHGQVRMDQFHAYHPPAQQTSYDSGDYHHGGNRRY